MIYIWKYQEEYEAPFFNYWYAEHAEDNDRIKQTIVFFEPEEWS